MVLPGEKFDSVVAYTSILETGRFADFEVECHGHKWRVHRSILYGQSQYFNRLLDGDFKEPCQGRVEFPADDQAVIARLLAYLYTGNVIGANTKYEESVISRGQFAGLVDPYKKCDFVKELELYIKMYCVAEKYLLPQLKDLALGHYCEKLQKWTQDIQSRNQHVTSTIFGSDLIPLVYEAELPDSDRDLKDPLLVLIHSDIRDTKHVNRYEHRHMLARAPSEFLFDLMMRPLKDYVLICEKCKEDVCVLDEYCICGMAGCNAQHCWPDEMKLVQCYLCGRRCFTRDGADID